MSATTVIPALAYWLTLPPPYLVLIAVRLQWHLLKLAFRV
jgi:hypothetical protein